MENLLNLRGVVDDDGGVDDDVDKMLQNEPIVKQAVLPVHKLCHSPGQRLQHH